MADFVRRSLFAHCTFSKDTVMVSSTRDTDVRRTKNIHGWNSPKTHGHLITHVPKNIYNSMQAEHSPHIFKEKYGICIVVLQTNTNNNNLDILHPMEKNYFEKIH